MVPDDPFTADPKARAVTTSGGSVTPSTITRPRSALHINISPPEHTEPVRDPDESGVIHMRTQGAGSGTKTPRRVQWEKESHVVQLEPMPSPNTVNRQNVMHIDAALERHRSNPRRPPIARMISEDGEDEDYDYRLDTGVPPGARLGGVRSNESHQQGNEPQSLSDILDDGINRHIDGETNIPLGETDGLPSIPNQGADNNSAAKNLVRAHTGKWGVLRRRVRGAGAVNNAFGGGGKGEVVDEKATRQREDDFAARYPEPEEEDHGHGRMHGMPPGMAGMPGGASVLSSLLALYNQQNLPGSGATSGATSAASSRPSSIYSQSDEEDTPPRKATPEMPAVRKTASGWWHPPRRNESNKSMQEVVINEENRRPSEVVMDLEPPNLEQLRGARSQSTSSLGSASGPSVGFMKSLKKAKEVTYDKTANRVKAEVNEYDRPKAARSGAGVFGALIQNTQNITGAATPTGATLAPAAARPGYQLNRYTLPTDVPQVTSPWRPASRLSNSTSRSRPTSVHSSTAVSDGGASPSDMKKVHSSDDMLAMKEKNRNRSGLRLDTLGKMPMQAVMAGGQALKTGANTVRNAEKWVMSGGKTPLLTPPGEKRGDSYFGRPLTEEERRRKEYEADKKRRRKAKEARKKQEIFIIQHVAAILARQQFLMKLARALMMFGSPSHRLETQLQATARVLELNAQVVYLPGTMLLSFGDDATHTSETKFLKQATGLDLGKLLATHRIYWNVVHDRMSVEQASKDLDMLMTTPVYYSWWQTLIIGGFASSFICVVGFYGSFIDAVVAAPLGALLCGIQMLSARNDMFSNVFEIAVACIISFIAAGLSSTGVFCYTALVSGGVVLILPGYIVLCGALELASRNITAGAVRIGYSVIYSLFLGFGISIGAEMFRQITGREVSNPNDYTCANTHIADIWWRVTPSAWWYFLCCPGFAFMLSLRNQQPLFAKEMPIMVLIACAGWASNHFSARVFVNRSDMTSAIGSFVVGTLGNLYGKLSKGSSFPVTVVGILFQLPSGLSNGGIFNFAVESSSGSTQAYSSGFEVAQQLVSVAIGLTVGLFVSAAVTHPFGGGRRRGSGIFSF